MWKETWRRWAKSDGCSSVAEARIADALDAWLPEGSTVAGYHALGNEPSLTRIIDGRRTWLAPRVDGAAMSFHDWHAATESAAFGLRQPTAAAPEWPASDIDVVVIPGLAFDRAGVRLGRGGGYFDRFLAANRGLETVGVIPAARLVEELPREPHDVAVRWIVTEAGVAAVRSA